MQSLHMGAIAALLLLLLLVSAGAGVASAACPGGSMACASPCPSEDEWRTEVQQAFHLYAPLHGASWYKAALQLLPAVSGEALHRRHEALLSRLLAEEAPADERELLAALQGAPLPPWLPCQLRFVRLLATLVSLARREQACGSLAATGSRVLLAHAALLQRMQVEALTLMLDGSYPRSEVCSALLALLCMCGRPRCCLLMHPLPPPPSQTACADIL